MVRCWVERATIVSGPVSLTGHVSLKIGISILSFHRDNLICMAHRPLKLSVYTPIRKVHLYADLSLIHITLQYAEQAFDKLKRIL